MASNSTCGAFTCDQVNAIQIATRLSGSLSLVGTIAIMASYALFKRFRTSSNKLLLYVTIGDFVFALMAVFGNSPVPNVGSLGSQTFCTIQGAISTYVLWCIMLWNVCMALQCLFAVHFQKPLSQLETFHKYYHVLCWGFPVIIVTIGLTLPNIYNTPNIPVMNNQYMFCWVSASYKNWRWIYYGPLWGSVAFNIAMYLVVILKLQMSRREISKHTSKESGTSRAVTLFVGRTFAYVGIFCLNWLFPTVNRIQGMISPDPIFWIYMCHATSAPIGGFLNSIAYFYFASLLEKEGGSSSNTKSTLRSRSTLKGHAGLSDSNNGSSSTDNGRFSPSTSQATLADDGSNVSGFLSSKEGGAGGGVSNLKDLI